MNLNEKQQEAVNSIDGPVRVIAGPGSGKTETITKRYEHLLSLGVEPHNVLMVTFTRKAANEMKKRISKRLPHLNFENSWVDTFHRICINILRMDGKSFGIPNDFRTCNNYESKKILKNIIDEHQLSGGSDEEEEEVTNTNALTWISALKTLLISPHSLIHEKPTLKSMDWNKAIQFIEKMKKESPAIHEALKIIYPEYQKELLRRKMLDFEDMMFYAAGLFDKNDSILNKYQQQFKYILVDEFQDTNFIQLVLLKLLSGSTRNLFVVGDDMQSIYAFRGAEIGNILDFEDHFPGSKTILLEENYRSTKRIISFSNDIISHNENQTQKKMFTQNEVGEKIKVIQTFNDSAEVDWIAKEILQLTTNYGFDYHQIAVLYRNNSHAVKFAKGLSDNKIPFQITGDTEFVERVEVRDMLAYLNLLENHEDYFSLRRVINKPKRGLGPKAVNTIFSTINGSSYEYLKENQTSNEFTSAGQKGLREVVNYIEQCSHTLRNQGIAAAIEHTISLLDYEVRVYDKSPNYIKEEVSEGLTEMIRIAKQAESEHEKMSIDAFKEYLTNLFVDEVNQSSKVTLMTIHKSKGLEFPVVFITGLDDETFPNKEKVVSEEELEEERRIFYVAATRAEKRLYCTYPLQREKRVEGSMQTVDVSKSLFIEETSDSEQVEFIKK